MLYGKIYHYRNPGLSERSHSGATNKLATQVDAAALLDDAAYESICGRGGCGYGSGAYAMLCFNPEGDDCERLDNIWHPDVQELPTGTPAEARAALRRRRDNTAWDGNNHVPHPIHNLEMLLTTMRANGLREDTPK